MKALRYLFPILLVLLCCIPLIAWAQSPEPDELDESLIPMPGPTQIPPTIDVHPATPATEELIEYPTATFHFGTAMPATEELIEYPTDPCAPSQAEIEADVILPMPGCVTPSTPQPTTMPNELPVIINGLWVMNPGSSNYNVTGNCVKPLGIGHGTGDGGGEVELPRVPACISPDNRWLTLDSDTVVEIAPGVYSRSRRAREVVVDASGTTTGTVNITYRTEYRIISPTEIEVVSIREEDGGCSSVSSVRYTLIEANEAVCVGAIITPEATLTPMPTTTLAPGETPEPIVTPEPPLPTGTYRVGLPLPDASCTAESLPPSDTVNISYTDNQDMRIDFGASSYTLFWDGGGSYQYMEKGLFQITVLVNPSGSNFTWAKGISAMSPPCYVSSDLVSADANAPTAPMTVAPTVLPTVDTGAGGSGSYTTSAQADAALCPADVASTIADINSATLTAQPDGSYLFVLGDKTYVLADMGGFYTYQEMGGDGSMVQISLNGFFQGQGSGVFYLITAGGGQCMMMLTFNAT